MNPALSEILGRYPGPAQKVWSNAEAETYRVGEVYVKYSEVLDLCMEAEKTAWVGRYGQAAEVVESGAHHTGTWIETRALAGMSAIDTSDTRHAASTIGQSLRRFHETLPVRECPWRGREFDDIEPDIVVGHGDTCVPNLILGSDTWIDLGDLGLTDRWWDVAVAAFSATWDINFGPGHDHVVIDAYCRGNNYPKITPPQGRISFYWEYYRHHIGTP